MKLTLEQNGFLSLHIKKKKNDDLIQTNGCENVGFFF